MSDYLANLAARSLGLAEVIRPRPVGLFEPPNVTDRPVAGPNLFPAPLESQRAAEAPADPPRLSRPTTGPLPESSPDVESPRVPPAILPPPPMQAEPQNPTPVLKPAATLLSGARAPGQVEPSASDSPEPGRAAAVQPKDPRPMPRPEPGLPVTAWTQEQLSPDLAQPALPRAQRPAAPEDSTPPLAPPLLMPKRVEAASRPPIAPVQMPVILPEYPSVPARPVFTPGIAAEETAPRPPALEMHTVLRSPQPAPAVTPERIIARPHITPAQSPGPTPLPATADRATSPPEPVVHVTIGRIEVRATPPPASAKREVQARQPALGLDEYLQRYGGKR